MTKCNYCGRELEENESFYIMQGKIYCYGCVEERKRTYCKIGGDPEDVHADNTAGE